MNRQRITSRSVRRSTWGAVIVTALLGQALDAHADLYGLVDNGQVVVSNDAGTSWETRALLLVPDAVGLVALSTSSDLYLLTRSGTLYASSNAGVDWEAVGSVGASDVAAVSVRDDLALLALTEGGVVHVSDDGGATFVLAGTLTAADAVSLVAGPGAAHVLTRTGLVFASLDGGVSWALAGTIPVSDAVEIVRAGTALYVASDAGDVWRSVDDGAGWVPVGTLSQVRVSGLVWGGSALAAVTREGMVALSSDGVAWQWVGAINQMSVVALATDSPVVSVAPDRDRFTLAVGAVQPNPITGLRQDLTLPVQISANATIRVFLYDVAGRLVAARAAEKLAGPGSFALSWEPGVLAAGVYVANVRSESASVVQRFVVVK